MAEITRSLQISRSVHQIPSRILCVCLLILQAASLNYYLISPNGPQWFWWIAVDIVVITTFLLAMALSYRHLTRHSHRDESTGVPTPQSLPHGFIAWFVYSLGLGAKVVVIFELFADDLEESDFFGPNTLKATCGLAGPIFLLLLAGLHDAPRSSKAKYYIDELTTTVVFDIIDAVESLEIMFLEEARDDFFPGMRIAIISIACFNFIIPTLPLVTLSLTKFGHKKLRNRQIAIHKLLLAYAVNFPLAVSRLIIWHGLSHGISIFLLKNIIMVLYITYDLYEHWREFAEKRSHRSHENRMSEVTGGSPPLTVKEESGITGLGSNSADTKL